MRHLAALLVALLSTPLRAEEPVLEKVLKDGDVAPKKRALAKVWAGPADEKYKPLLREAMKNGDRGVRQAPRSPWRGRVTATRR